MSDTTKKAPDTAATQPDQSKKPAPAEQPKTPAPVTEFPTPPAQMEESETPAAETPAPDPASESETPAAETPAEKQETSVVSNVFIDGVKQENTPPEASGSEEEIIALLDAHFETVKGLDEFRLAPDLVRELKDQHNRLEMIFVRMVPSLALDRE